MKQEHIAACLIGVSAIAVAPTIAIADTVLNPQNQNAPLTLPRQTGQLFAPVKSVVMLQARDTRNDLGPDPRSREPSVPLTTSSALSRFRLGFANGDHHIREITVLRSGARARGVLADVNGDDNFTFTAAWWNIPGATGGEVTAQHTGSTWQDIDIPPGPPNTTLALSGFSVRANSDAEILSFEVDLNPETLKARMRMSLARSASPGNTFDYVLQYVWIPNFLIANTRVITGNGTGDAVRLPAGTNGALPTNDRYVLQSFLLHYDNYSTAENLLHLGVHLDQTNAQPGRPSDVVTWSDNDRNERIYWQVTYLTLK